VISSDDLEQKQIERVSDALREVPGLSVVQTGTPGQLTSVFTRGLNSAHTQVLLDGIPINQGLAGQFDFANLTTDNIERIEVVRGPQSTIYGPRALAGVIQIFTKRGDGAPGITLSAEGGSYDTFREALESDGKIDNFDYSIGASRLDTDNARPNNQYRNSAGIADVGWSPSDHLRIGSLFTYSLSDTGNPNTIFDPKPIDNFLTEKWLIAPHVDLRIGDWWEHKFIFSYDHERQLNDPNQDGFVGPTRALFERTQVDYQNDLRPISWLTLTSGFLLQPRERWPRAAICPPDLWSAADIHKRSHRRNGWLPASNIDADDKLDFRRGRALGSFQSIRRRLDVSLRRQLQDRQDEHDVTLERCNRVQSARAVRTKFSATISD
jgi:vitamin B12 transporter